jgi:hypothetical protein
MARRRLAIAEVRARAGRWQLDDLEQKPKKRSPPRVDLDRAAEELDGDGFDWSSAEPKHFVALYRRLHARIYEAPALDLERAKDRIAAVGAARRMMDKHFGGKPERLAGYLRWVWRRERALEPRRREANSGKRLSWRHVFVWTELVTEYRVASARAKKTAAQPQVER